MFRTPDNVPLYIQDMYKNMPVFLLCGGPSLKDYDLSLLKTPGILTMGTNNVPSVHRTNMWVSADSPSNFLLSIWKDPSIMKFAPIHTSHDLLWDSSKQNVSKDFLIGDSPNLITYVNAVQHLYPETWLSEPVFTWGLPQGGIYSCLTTGKKYTASRSVFLIALKILIVLGFRRIYLLGVDFNMSSDKEYAFKSKHTKETVKYNNRLYAMVQAFLLDMIPYFDNINLQIFNCNEYSGLRLYPYIPYEKALEDNNLSDLISKESTDGHYDSLDKKAKINNIDLSPYIVEPPKTSTSSIEKK